MMGGLRDWLRARRAEWAVSGFLPPRDETLRWPHLVRMCLASAVALNLVVFLVFFLAFPDLWFGLTGPAYTPPAIASALLRCWQSGAIGLWSCLGLGLSPLWVIESLWNKRAKRLSQMKAQEQATPGRVWPPPPRQPGL